MSLKVPGMVGEALNRFTDEMVTTDLVADSSRVRLARAQQTEAIILPPSVGLIFNPAPGAKFKL